LRRKREDRPDLERNMARVFQARQRRLRREQPVARPVEEVFEFFSDPRNLEALTPPFLHFRILTPLGPRIEPGLIIEYRLRLHGVPLQWKSLIEAVDPGKSFTDVQIRGPYRRWRHVHDFRADGEGTCVVDTVEYELPFPPVGDILGSGLVERRLARIFDYRRDRIAELLPARSGGASPA